MGMVLGRWDPGALEEEGSAHFAAATLCTVAVDDAGSDPMA